MRPLSAAALLDVWERGHASPPARQALLLLAAACPEEAPEERAGRSVGRRDADLMTLRTWTFGDRLDGVVTCPACQEMLELDLPVAALMAEPPADDTSELEVRRDGFRVRFRLPTAADLAEVVGGPGSGPRHLLARCVVEAERGGEPVGPDELPDPVVGAVGERMGSADPRADVAVDLTCPACHHGWEVRFDIVSFFWTEIDRWARRTLRDVHALARAYGWSEAEILALSAWRRQGYLSLIRE